MRDEYGSVPVTRADAIVLGAGGVGSAALYHLAKRGQRALGLDRFPPAHDRGSSHGDTRIIRQAYFEHRDYVPLLLRAYELWSELEKRSGKTLYTETGLLEVGPEDGEVVPGVIDAARTHGLAVEELDASEIERRFPGFRVPEGLVGVFERDAGYLAVEDCVRTHVEQAEALGAKLETGVTVHGWQPHGDRAVTVDTDHGSFETERLIVTPGAWAGDLLGDIGVELGVLRKSLFWYRPKRPTYRADRAPCFLYELQKRSSPGLDRDCVFYGFVDIDEQGLKVAEHTGGQQVDDPLLVDRELHEDEARDVETFLNECLPDAGAEPATRVKHAVCMYTITPDRHFVVDRHPRHPGVVYAAGLSGHGFKFTSVLGEVLADLAIEGGTSAPVGFLGAGRFG